VYWALDELTLLYNAFLSESDDHPLKADGLNLCGDQFLEVFRNTGNDNDISQAITAYEQAAACLSPDDPRLGVFLHDIGIGYLERYDRLEWLNDLETAITTMKIVTADEHTDLPASLDNLGISFCRRFKRIGDLDDLSEAI